MAGLCNLALLVVAVGCAGRSDESSGDGAAGTAGDPPATAGAGGAAAGADGGMVGSSDGRGIDGQHNDSPPPLSHVTVNGTAWPYQQGEITGWNTSALDGVSTLTAVLRSYAFDRCSDGMAATVPTETQFLSIAIPAASVGHYDLPYYAVLIGSDGATNDASNPGTLEITRVDSRSIEGSVDVTMAISGAVVSGTFTVDACGFAGERLISGIVCPAPSSMLLGGTIPDSAVSPSGRIAVATSYKVLTVYAPDESGGTCSYAPDPAYGVAGTVTFDNQFTWASWDDAERLYATTEVDVTATVPQAAPLYRVTPGQSPEFCRLTGTLGVPSNTPSAMFVLPDGSAAYFSWDGTTEVGIDLQDPNFGKGDGICKFIAGAGSAVRYTLASSGIGDRLLFFQTIDGERRAVETDTALAPTLMFGGTPSGYGEQGMADVQLLSRCPTGYCAANDFQLKVFAPDGSIRQIVRMRPDAFVLPVEPTYFLTRFLGPGVNGTAWLRGKYDTGQEAVVHLVPK